MQREREKKLNVSFVVVALWLLVSQLFWPCTDRRLYCDVLKKSRFVYIVHVRGEKTTLRLPQPKTLFVINLWQRQSAYERSASR